MVKKPVFENDKLIIYTDGGSRGNPGPAAIAVVIADERDQVVKSYSKTIGQATNNEAEYEALLFGLQKVRALFGKVKIKRMDIEMRADSELVVEHLNGRYKIEEERLWPRFMKVWNTRLDFGEIQVKHVSRSKNKEADRLVNQALDSQQGSLL